MEHTATSLIQHLGYAGLGLGLIVATLGLFSSEVFLLLGGAAVHQHSLNLIAALTVALVAQLIGALISHTIGRYGGVPLVERYGRYVLLSRRDLGRAERWFDRRGRAATALAYSLPLIRGYAGYAAGIAREPRGRFAGGVLIGSLIWSVIMMALGFYLSGHIGAILSVIRPISYLLVVLVAVAVAVFVRRRLQEARV